MENYKPIELQWTALREITNASGNYLVSAFLSSFDS